MHITKGENIQDKVYPEIGCTSGIMLFQTEEYFPSFYKDGSVF